MNKFLLTILLYCLSVTAVRPVQAQIIESDSAASLVSTQFTVDSRITQLKAYLMTKNKNLVNDSEFFVSEADRVHIDWRLVAAIAGLESSFCLHIPNGSYNCWGWGIPGGAEHGIGFTSFRDGITVVSEGLRDRYINEGRISLDQIGSMYAASPTWASRVRFFMNDIENYRSLADSLEPSINL
ncbi:hypothetical protein A2154_04475 [Candidatus Gottesmanbacteria bacterium RBG_16_43_7]|uniref:Mannosyl-glycoprotein endo-beta-N-acetylglucosamidase-like domain-containing protein n=1 Tax=Candidatus Gottesmanbacteria bacterium RBG_16_43_7 TaxID=1798373 RepID=A0A1F5Z892_9BACT|nr:MAG: hypothetical protein A2154_04475 [Candidatus Gottesmanbacteria bacterium RBG_16_43_7]